uniref:Chromatin target of PRMT1 protein-like n=1 Tax=Phallusia mammillata TaxID=59560 RepID=A0A6F9D9Z5_9ASCI|nr:chromatin target of PRMT1 protein-like [Phallusia mammillata]
MASQPIKISLKNTTKMTLNSRFTTIMKSRPTTSPQTVRTQASTAKMASEKNRRLTQQMERRPTVEQALGLGQQQSPPKQSVLDRLGNKTMRGRGRGVTTAAKRFQVNRQTAGRLGIQQNNFTRGNLKTNRGRGRGRGVTSVRGGPLSRTYGNNNKRGQTKPSRGNTRGRGGQRGRGSKRGGKTASREQLDTDLDSYMSKNKTNMDAELDAYMADAAK